MKKIKPLGTRLVIKPDDSDMKTAGGIIIPDSARERQQTGVVIAAGEGSEDDKMYCKVGDTVLYGKDRGTEITLDDCQYLIMGQTDVLAIL